MAKVNLEIVGKDKASGSVKGITKSIITAQLAIEGIKIAITALVNAGKKSIEMFRTQEQAEAKLAAQTGGNIDAYKKFASEIQAVTTIGDEQVIAMQQLGLTMGITNTKIEESTKGAIGLSEAFGIDLNASMKMVALATEGEYNMLARYIPEIRSATTEAEKHAIVQAAMANGFDIATAKAETFTGGLEQLSNIQGDNYEAFGKIISVIGDDYVNSMIDAQTALNDFLTDTEKIAGLAATFEVVKTVVKDVAKEGFGKFKEMLIPLKEKWDELIDGVGEGVSIFDILGVAVKMLSISLSVMIKILGIVITYFADNVRIVKEAIQVFGAFWDAATGKGSWKEAISAVKDVGTAYTDVYKNIYSGTKDLISSTLNEFKTLNADSKANADKYAQIRTDTNAKIKADMDTTQSEMTAKQKEEEEKRANGTKDNKDKEGVTWQNWSNAVQGLTADLYSTLMDARDSFYESQFEKFDEWKEAHLEGVDDWMTREMESQGVAEETRSEQLAREIEELQGTSNEKMSIEDKEKQAMQIKEKQDELARIKIMTEGSKKKAEIESKAAKKEHDLKKKQFEENKAFQIAQIWINAAASVMGWWAAFAGMGIPGIVLAAVMTAGTLVMAGVQTGLVASQSFAEGGMVKGLGGIDNVPINASAGELILNEAQQGAVAGKLTSSGESGNIYIENWYSSAKSLDEVVEETVEIRRIEGART